MLLGMSIEPSDSARRPRPAQVEIELADAVEPADPVVAFTTDQRVLEQG
jgi:hypothetical protein